MTGFGRGSAATDDFLATVEVSSVNRKQSEIIFQAPRELAGLEAATRHAATAVTSRGRLQITVRLDRPTRLHRCASMHASPTRLRWHFNSFPA